MHTIVTFGLGLHGGSEEVGGSAGTYGACTADVLALLNEASDSPVAEQPDGVGGTTTTSAVQIRSFLYHKFCELARVGVPINGRGTASMSANARRLAYADMTPDTTGRVMWQARTLAAGGTTLPEMHRNVAELAFPKLATTASGSPRYWFEDGSGVSLIPRPVATVEIVCEGLMLPAAPTDENSAVDALPVDLVRLACYGAAELVAAKNLSIPGLGEYAKAWGEAYRQGVQMARLGQPFSVLPPLSWGTE